ncbi:hypothetical protein L798_08537 [Zootermopsis nevadensis]|uniref:Uncharacterized protein n=1 Tax=Zootermopsis nevadensis TaxID=136037 RepID=A0A067RC18_ZOONE|nr:hypothetical protein L798_08537 [Zootermopsis nevadensis]
MYDFYSSFFRSSCLHTPRPPPPPCAVLAFLSSEMRSAVKGFRREKAPGADDITAELLKSCGFRLYTALASRFSRYLRDGEVPDDWHFSRTILLFKKSDREDLANTGRSASSPSSTRSLRGACFRRRNL